MRWHRCLPPLAVLLAALAAQGATGPAGTWERYDEEGGCIGGSRCGDQGDAIRVPLEDAPVWGVRFLAHDNVGPRTRGHLRVRIDRRTLARDIDVPRAGKVYTLQVEGARGHTLIFEAIANDEVVVQDIEVQYSGLRDPLGRPAPGGIRSPGASPTPPSPASPGSSSAP